MQISGIYNWRRMHLLLLNTFVRYVPKIIIKAVSWKKLQLVRHKGIYISGISDHRDAKQFSNVIFLSLLGVVLQIWYCVYSISVDDITRKRKFKGELHFFLKMFILFDYNF